MSQSYADFGDLDIQQSGGQEEAEFGALELQQAQVLFSALNALRQGQPPLAWEGEAAAEIEVGFTTSCWNITMLVRTETQVHCVLSQQPLPCLQDIKERTSQAATATDDPIARRQGIC